MYKECLCLSCKYATWDSVSFYGTNEEMGFVDGCCREDLIDPESEDYEENEHREVVECPEYCYDPRCDGGYYDEE